MKTTVVFASLLIVFCLVDLSQADVFGSGSDVFEIEFVEIGNPGNVAGLEGGLVVGSVAYDYRIGKHEISVDMIEKANSLDSLGITKDNRSVNKPATSISWFEAAKFVNWLNRNTGNSPAYRFDDNGVFRLWEPIDAGYDPENLYRNSLAKYFLPSADEWHKAAYYDPDEGRYYVYPTGSDTPPTPVASGTLPDTAVHSQAFTAGPADIMQAGGLSPYGTMAQGSNVSEWEETEFDLVNSSPYIRVATRRGIRGGSWSASPAILSVRGKSFPDIEHFGIGFRVASIAIPEPTTLSLALAAVVFFVLGSHRVD